jgi:hypothetical protein
MKLKFENVMYGGLAIAAGLSLFSCTEDKNDPITEPQNKARLEATARQSSPENGRTNVNGFVVSEFAVGTKNVEMKYFAAADLVAGIDLGDLELKSNLNAGLQSSSSEEKSMALISGGESKVSIVGEGDTPEGNYKEVTFELYQNQSVQANDPMYKKSMWITGEVNGKLTQLWTEKETVIEASSESSTGIEVEENSELLLVFELEELFKGVDFASAVDANADGRIDIYPNSPDGNAEILAQIESNLKNSVKFEEQ